MPAIIHPLPSSAFTVVLKRFRYDTYFPTHTNTSQDIYVNDNNSEFFPTNQTQSTLTPSTKLYLRGNQTLEGF